MRYYHMCLSGNDEIMFRTDEDYRHAINCLVLAAYKTESSILAYAFMSTHLHLCIKTDNPYKMMTIYRYAYTRYFNRKYRRQGKLGEVHPFVIELDGLYHILTAICYVLRNPLHHGVSETAFGYPYSSIQVYFRKAMGKDNIQDAKILSPRHHSRHLPHHTIKPEKYRMNEQGTYIMSDFVSHLEVEHMFVTARSFCFYMNRISSEEWMKEQEKDQNGKDKISLQRIEDGVTHNSLSDMLKNEYGKSNYKKISDIELCTLIDKSLPSDSSVYTISDRTKEKIYRDMIKAHRSDHIQTLRCLSLPVAKYKF